MPVPTKINQSYLEKWPIPGHRLGKYTAYKHPVSPETRKRSKTHRIRSKGQEHQPEGASTGQRWNNLPTIDLYCFVNSYDKILKEKEKWRGKRERGKERGINRKNSSNATEKKKMFLENARTTTQLLGK